MKEKELEDEATFLLQGKRIKNVYYTEQEGVDYLIPTIELDNGTLLYIQSDEEGNDAGTIHTNLHGAECIMPKHIVPINSNLQRKLT